MAVTGSGIPEAEKVPDSSSIIWQEELQSREADVGQVWASPDMAPLGSPSAGKVALQKSFWRRACACKIGWPDHILGSFLFLEMSHVEIFQLIVSGGCAHVIYLFIYLLL